MVIRRKFIGYWIATDRMKRLYSWQKIRKQKIKVERGVDNWISNLCLEAEERRKMCLQMDSFKTIRKPKRTSWQDDDSKSVLRTCWHSRTVTSRGRKRSQFFIPTLWGEHTENNSNVGMRQKNYLTAEYICLPIWDCSNVPLPPQKDGCSSIWERCASFSGESPVKNT